MARAGFSTTTGCQTVSEPMTVAGAPGGGPGGGGGADDPAVMAVAARALDLVVDGAIIGLGSGRAAAA